MTDIREKQPCIFCSERNKVCNSICRERDYIIEVQKYYYYLIYKKFLWFEYAHDYLFSESLKPNLPKGYKHYKLINDITIDRS